MERILRRVDEFRSDLEKMDKAHLDAVALERTVQTITNELGVALFKQVLSYADETAPEIKIHGESWGNRRVTPGTYTCLYGEITLTRSTYQRSGRGRVAVPVELRLGMVERRYTPLLARVMGRAIAVMTDTEAEGLLTEIGVAKISRSTIHRIPQAITALYEQHRETIESAIQEQENIPEEAVLVQASLDGAMVPQDSEHSQARGRKPKEGTSAQPPRHEITYGVPQEVSPAEVDNKSGRAWHEAGVGTLSFWDKDGNRLKTIYKARMPEARKQTLVGQVQQELLSIVKERPDLKVQFASDGAPLHWEQFEQIKSHLPAEIANETTMMLDFFHASEYLAEAANIVSSEPVDASVQQSDWREQLKGYADGPKRVLKSLRYFRDGLRSAAKKEELESIISYLANQASAGRMKYAAAKKQHAPIGTGVVEAACKTLVGVRMKRAGARFTQHGGQTVLLFRSCLYSDRFDQLMTELTKLYSADVRIAA